MPKSRFVTQTKASTSSSRLNSLDLRAPLFARLRKGTGLEQFRVISLISLDAMLLSLAWLIAEVQGTPSFSSPWSLQHNPLALVGVLGIEIGLMAAQGLYQKGDKRRDYFGLIKTLTFSHLLLVLIAFLYQPGYFVSRSTFLWAWTLSLTFACAGRLSSDLVLRNLRAKGTGRTAAFLICSLGETEKAIELIEQENCFEVVGITNTCLLNKHAWETALADICCLGVSHVFVCSWDAKKNRMFLYWSLRSAGISIHLLPIGLDAYLEAFTQRAEFEIVGGLPAITFYPPIISGSDFYLKRCFDFTFSALFLLLTAPLLLSISLVVKLDSPGSVFYKQPRIGLHGQQFEAWKFRTMVTNADQLQKKLEVHNQAKDGVLFKIKDDPRITRIGKFLRRYSLDELPQIFNVLFGQMSLVGPRPLPIRDVEKFSDHHFIRQEVLPGITGLWQVSGRSDILDFEEVLRLDVSYIENWSFKLDLQILLQTIQVVFQKKGAY